MRSVSRILIVAAGICLVGSIQAWADPPHAINYDYHDPIDLKAYTPPGPQPGTDGEGVLLVEPPRKLDPALLNDPDEVKWPTLDKSEWLRLKSHYTIVPQK